MSQESPERLKELLEYSRSRVEQLIKDNTQLRSEIESLTQAIIAHNIILDERAKIYKNAWLNLAECMGELGGHDAVVNIMDEIMRAEMNGAADNVRSRFIDICGEIK